MSQISSKSRGVSEAMETAGYVSRIGRLRLIFSTESVGFDVIILYNCKNSYGASIIATESSDLVAVFSSTLCSCQTVYLLKR